MYKNLYSVALRIKSSQYRRLRGCLTHCQKPGLTARMDVVPLLRQGLRAARHNQGYEQRLKDQTVRNL